MTEVVLAKFSIKSGKKQVWLDWCEELKRRKEEVIATLKNEGVVSESCFITDDGHSVYYFMEAKDIARAKEAALKNPHPIDKEHKERKKISLDKPEVLTNLFHFENRHLSS